MGQNVSCKKISSPEKAMKNQRMARTMGRSKRGKLFYFNMHNKQKTAPIFIRAAFIIHLKWSREASLRSPFFGNKNKRANSLICYFSQNGAAIGI